MYFEFLVLIYLTNLGHNFDFSNSNIFTKENNLDKRLILELIEIFNNINSINTYKAKLRFFENKFFVNMYLSNITFPLPFHIIIF